MKPWLQRSSRLDVVSFIVPVALIFLFIGFIKGVVPSPVDLTLASVGLLCVLLLLSRSWISVSVRSPITWLLAALSLLLIVRLFPDPTPWGVRKAAEMVALGGPAYLAGTVIGRSDNGVDLMAKWFAYLGVPISAYLVFFAAVNDPYSFSYVGSAGYQLTGTFLGFAMIGSVYLRNPWCFGAAVLGVAVTGNLSGTIFAGLGVLVLWLSERNLVHIAKQVICAVVALASYWLLVAPPLVLMRVLWKMGGMVLSRTSSAGTLTPEQSVETLRREGGTLGLAIIDGLARMPEDSQRYLVDVEAADRSLYYADALALIRENWWFGHGYGVPTYAGETYPHNLFLEMLAEGGVLAAILAAAILGAALVASVRSKNLFVTGLLVSVSLTAMVSGYWGGRTLMLVIGLAVGAVAANQPLERLRSRA